jgi:hypothetical protein
MGNSSGLAAVFCTPAPANAEHVLDFGISQQPFMAAALPGRRMFE